ncbi:MAG: molybdenum cofactor biosynthesis protein MoaE [Bryobacteraceae bacterium]|nr:molybdenum cofactor biosynthesis protein MoaE [Bryobacteraceae bacterium]
MKVHVLFFGIARDITGLGQDTPEVADGASVADVLCLYAARFPRLDGISASLVMAVNQEFSDPGHLLADGDEVAFLPPVSGGSDPWTQAIEHPDGHFFALTRHAIDARHLARRLLRGEDGAAVTFEGVTRNNSKGRPTLYLDYECYEAMAIRVMAQIGQELARAYAIDRIAMAHRLGRVEIGEASVVIVVTAAHRKPAFEACSEAITRLKKLVPIWKKEHFEDGAVWVEGDWDESVSHR